MIIDSKLPGFKSYLSENRLTNAGVKTTIDQSAVATSEQNDVKMDLADDETNNPYSSNKKKKKEKKQSSKNDDSKKPQKIETDAELKSKNMKLLNLL